MAIYIDADKIILNGLENKSIEVRTKELIEKDEYVVSLLFRDLQKFIDSLPTADVRENVKGEWIKESEHSVMGDGYMWFCSICGRREYFNFRGQKDNFCPNCGADMRGEEND